MNSKKRYIVQKSPDFILMITTITLVFIGIIMVFSSSWPEALVNWDDGYLLLKKQIVAATLGFIAMIGCMNIDYRIYYKYAFPIFIISIISCLLILTPLGLEINGARRWIDLGITTFMPSDLMKIGSIIYFSSYLTRNSKNLKSLTKGTIPTLIVIGIACSMIYIQKDLGTTLSLATTMMAVFFVAGIKLLHLLFMGCGGALLLYLSIVSEGNEYRLSRWTTFLDPFADKLGAGYQVVQSLYALGSGGLFGLGLGKSRQKFFYIPSAYNDFIFAIIGEELGLVGTLTVLFLFLILIWRGIVIALKIEDFFGCLLATGITAQIAIQTLINIAVATSSIPTTGITLPFISYGGTSLAFYLASIGILLNISRKAKLDRS